MRDFIPDYVRLAAAYVDAGAEHTLVEIEDLARRAVEGGKPVEEFADLHEAALLALAERGGAVDARTIRRASTCLGTMMVAATSGCRAQIDLVEHDRARAYAERARQRLETLGLMIGGMAHEISNLLQPIGGLCELALLDMPDDAAERETLQIVADCAKRASSVLRNVLAYGRYAEPVAASTAFGAAVRRGIDFVSSVSMLWPTIATEIADAQSPAIIVEDELTQILLNLVQNAAQAHATRIDVSVTRTLWRFPDAPAVRRPALRLAVADDGCGMDANTLIKASIPFFSGKPPGEGTGMGLAVVGGIVKSWSGQMTITSRPGEGTTTSIYLPVDEGERAAEAS
jgi:hypothetical protein